MAEEATTTPTDASATEGHVAPAVTHPSAENITKDPTADNAPASILDESEDGGGDAVSENETETPEGEKKGGEGDEAGDDDKPDGAPETYEAFAVPEGVTLNEAAVEAAVPVFKELGLKQEQAQKLVDLWTAQARATEEANLKALQDYNAALTAKVKADPEIGGAALKSTLATVRKGLAAFDKGGAFERLLKETGFGNEPDVLRFLKAVGEAQAEDTFERGGAAAQPPAKGDLTSIYKPEIMKGTS